MQNGKPYVVAAALLAVLALLAGCAASDNAIGGYVRQLPEVKAFLEQNPNATIKLVLLDANAVRADMNFIAEKCGRPLPVQEYYQVTVEDQASRIFIWLTAGQQVQCLVREATGKQPADAKATGFPQGLSKGIGCDDNNPQTIDFCNPLSYPYPKNKPVQRPDNNAQDSVQANRDCKSLGGEVCTESQLCSGTSIEAADTAYCCSGKCARKSAGGGGPSGGRGGSSGGTETQAPTAPTIAPSVPSVQNNAPARESVPALSMSTPQATGITTTSASITWTTTEPSDGKIRWGTTQQIATNTTPFTLPCCSTDHNYTIAYLDPGTLYYFTVYSATQSGQSTGGTVHSFTTTSLPKPAPLPAPVLSGISATGITSNSASVTWKSNVETKGAVSYGTTTSLGSSATESAYSPDHNVQLTGLAASTTYYYAIDATDTNNLAAHSAQYSFATLASPPVISGAQVTIDNVRGLHAKWTTDVGADAKVLVNTNQSQLGSGSDLVFANQNQWQDHKVLLNALAPNTTYYYTISSTNANGTATTPTGTYTTPGPIAISNVNVAFGTLNGIPIATFSWASSASGSTAVAFSNSDQTLEVSNGPTGIADSSAGTSHSITTGFDAGKTYYYKVMTYSGSGYGESAITTFTMPG